MSAVLRTSGNAIRQRGYQRHLLQVGFVDRLLGQVLDRLQQTGLYERSLILLTSDHGICFRYGELRRDVTKSNAIDLLPVVLMMKLPGEKKGGVNDRNVENPLIFYPRLLILCISRFPGRRMGRLR